MTSYPNIQNFWFRSKLLHKAPAYYARCPGFEPISRHKRLLTSFSFKRCRVRSQTSPL